MDFQQPILSRYCSLQCYSQIQDVHPPIHLSQLRLAPFNIRQNPRESRNRRREEVLPTLRHDKRTDSIQLDRPFRILRKHAGGVHLFVLAQLAQDSIETNALLDEVPLVGPLALNEGKPVADGALIADEEQAAGTFGVGVEFVALYW